MPKKKTMKQMRNEIDKLDSKSRKLLRQIHKLEKEILYKVWLSLWKPICVLFQELKLDEQLAQYTITSDAEWKELRGDNDV